MYAVELIENLGRRGIHLIADGDGIIVEPSRLLTDTDRAAIRAHKAELLALLGASLTPVQSIIEICRRHGVALRIDEDGDLVVGKAGAKADKPTQPWRSLLVEIEANLEPVARLVEAGWHLRAAFPDANDGVTQQ
jgi:hypothetical protein